MEQIIPVLLLFLFACIPALLFRPLQLKRYLWGFLLCAGGAAILLPEGFVPGVFLYALLLGAYLYFAVYRPRKQGKFLGFCLCFSGCMAVLGAAHALLSSDFPSLTGYALLLYSLTLGVGYGFALRIIFREESDDVLPLSEEQKLSPRLPLLMILLCQMFLLLFGAALPVLCLSISLFLALLSLLLLSLWSNMSLAVLRSRECSELDKQSRQAIDHVNRGTEAELQRRMTESNNRLLQASFAFRRNDKEELQLLLGAADESGSITYSDNHLLDAILRHRAYEARRSEMTPSFRLQLGAMKGFDLSDIGVVLDMMLGMMSEHHPGHKDMLRLRMQEWGDTLVIVVGRHDCLRMAPEEQMNAMRHLVEEYGGCLELAEWGRDLCLSAVLFRPPAAE